MTKQEFIQEAALRLVSAWATTSLTSEDVATAANLIADDVWKLFEEEQQADSTDSPVSTDSVHRVASEIARLESEDEKIRKWIIIYLNNRILNSAIIDEKKNCMNAVTWLEKQGEKETNGNNREIPNSEQKPVDKVEPKFKVGDWITNRGHSYLIADIDTEDGRYLFEIGGYTHEQLNWEYIENADKKYHLWTIQDARGGDVLCDYHESYDNPLIFILKKFEHVKFGLVEPSDYSSYCFLTAGDRQRFKEGTYHHEHNTKPATKEQRDILFQKMKEDGYEWDAEKKLLKKIEQKPAWSEEDERMKNQLVDFMLSGIDISKAPCGCGAWLKSLRPQKQWKPSNEQMTALKDALNDAIWQYSYKGSPIKEEVTRKYAETIKSLYNDLEKLK